MGEQAKKLLRDYGIIMGFVLVMFAALIVLTRATRPAWYGGLGRAAQAVLGGGNSEQEIQIGSPVPVRTPISTGAAAFSTDDPDTFVLVLRVQTLYGPYPGVFVYRREQGSRFAGFACVSPGGAASERLSGGTQADYIEYWNRQVPKIIETALNAEGAGGWGTKFLSMRLHR